MTVPRVGRFPLSGPQLITVLATMVLATAVLPPGVAWWLNRSRIARTRTQVAIAAGDLRARPTDLVAAAAALDVACGPGRVPDLEPASRLLLDASALRTHQVWVTRAARAPALFGSSTRGDAWGRCFLINVRDWASGGPVWLLSAGPDGLVETPPAALEIGGDDIGQRLR